MQRPRLVLDHIVLTTRDLTDGVAWIEERVGTKLLAGGKHALMGTHNALMRLGGNSYLEVIAVDPQVPPPGRPRWFGLDDPHMRGQLAYRPRLATWVVRSSHISATAAASAVDLGDVLEMTRGALSWRITVRPDGTMPEGGLFPSIIEWPPGVHPTRSMADLGLGLERLTLFYEAPYRLDAALSRIGAEDLVRVQASAAAGRRLEAVLRTPAGLVILD